MRRPEPATQGETCASPDADYTVRVLMYVVVRPEPKPAIASIYGMSRDHVTKVVCELGAAGVIGTVRGKKAGCAWRGDAGRAPTTGPS
jgi:DNA-binding IscR family transcriptional regulator